jgi:hypothetical protein
MKKFTVALSVLLLCLLALPAFAADKAAPVAGSWTGWITDSHCAEKGANDKHTKDCAAKCLKEGGKLMFMNSADKKMYEIDKAGNDMAMSHVGHMVKVTGSVDGSMMKVDKIEMAEMKKM